MVMRRNLLSEIPRSTPSNDWGSNDSGRSDWGSSDSGSSDWQGRDARGRGAKSSDETDFARWLTRDLRHKGSNEPRSRERVRLPASVVVAQPESDFARWLRTDLRPRNSSLPPSEFATVEAIVPAARPIIPAPGPLPAADSFVPQTIEEPLEEPIEEELKAPLPSETVLDEEDLAVLPSRRRRKGARRWPALALLLGLLCLGGGIALWGGHGQPSAAALAASPSPVVAAAEPAPAAPEVTDPALPALTAAPSHHASRPASVEPQLPAALGHGRGNGASTARFADLPLPTLSRLAKDEKQRTGERDAKARAAGKANRKSSPVQP